MRLRYFNLKKKYTHTAKYIIESLAIIDIISGVFDTDFDLENEQNW